MKGLNEDRTRNWFGLHRAAGVAALLVTAILLIGIVGLVIPLQGLGLRNWLVVLFELNGGMSALPADPLRVFNPLDIAALILVGVTYLGLWPTLSKVNKFWMSVAIALPFAGIAFLMVTDLAGRSAVMGGGLIIAILMLKIPTFRPLGILGAIATAFLLVGDFVTGARIVPVVAAIIGVGYIMLGAWFLSIGTRFLGAAWHNRKNA